MASQLEQQATLLRERIKSVDENIKKLTGRDPSEIRPLFQRRGMRRRDNRKRTFSESDVVAKRRLVDNSGKRRSNFKRRGEGSSESEADDDDDEEEKPMVQSSVVVTERKQSRMQRHIELLDDKSKARNRRMFGSLLMGTLQKFKTESQERSEKEMKKAIIEEKLDVAQREEKEKATAERRELYSKRRMEQAELRRVERQIDLIETEKRMEGYYSDLSVHIKTKASPQLFYVPAQHNDKTIELFNNSKTDILELHKNRVKEMREHIADIEKKIAERRMKSATGEVDMGEEEGEIHDDEEDDSKVADGNNNTMDVDNIERNKEDKVEEKIEEEEEEHDDVEMSEV